MQVKPSDMADLERSFKEYTKKVFESDEQLSKAEANWKRHKREIKDIFWENDLTSRQLKVLRQDNWKLFNAPRKYFLRKKFFQMKADHYAHLRSGPNDGKGTKYTSDNCISTASIDRDHATSLILFSGESLDAFDLRTRSQKTEIGEFFRKHQEIMAFSNHS